MNCWLKCQHVFIFRYLFPFTLRQTISQLSHRSHDRSRFNKSLVKIEAKKAATTHKNINKKFHRTVYLFLFLSAGLLCMFAMRHAFLAVELPVYRYILVFKTINHMLFAFFIVFTIRLFELFLFREFYMCNGCVVLLRFQFKTRQ